MKFIRWIKFNYWWYFKATVWDKLNYDLWVNGVAIVKLHNQALDNAQRISSMNFYIDPKE